MSVRKKTLSLALALCLTWSLAAPALASESAASIRLSKTTGTVTVSKSSEKTLTLLSNMRLYNGYHVTTGAKSYAWMNLDDTKLIKEDASSEVEVRKDGKKLTVNVCSGNVFFNVSEKLKDDESLNISTSTMIVGIRGTAGYVQTEDKSTTRITILEGSAQCSVTDPVTGQVETATVQSGQTATCQVNPDAETGDKCSIRTEGQTVESIPGFVLTDVVRDMELCERIQEDTGTDVLAELAQIVGGDPSGKSPDGRTASPEILGEADRRESEDDSDRQQRQQQAEEAQARENDDISADKALAPKNGGTSGGDSGGSGGGTNIPSKPSGPVTVNLTMPVTVSEVQTALRSADVVNLRPNTSSTAAGSTLTVEAGAVLDVAAGKTLHLETGVDLAVNGSFHVNGTVTANNITSSGDITVNSADTLYVKGNLISTGNLTVTDTGKLVVDGDFSHKSVTGLFLGGEAKVLSKLGYSGVALPADWYAGGTERYNGSEYVVLEFIPSWRITFEPNGGTVDGGIAAVTRTTGAGGKLASLPTAARTANTGATAAYTFDGWFTAAEGGEQVTADTVFTADATVYAHWTSSGGWDWAMDGTGLRLFGTGDVAGFSTNASAPWGTDPTDVTVEEGITGVGSYAFLSCTSLTSVEVKGAASIAAAAFLGCTGLIRVTLLDSGAAVDGDAFQGCAALSSINYGGTKAMWNAFNFNDPTDGQVVIHCSDGDLSIHAVAFEGNGGTVDAASALLYTGLSGTLSTLPTAARTANTGSTVTYTFDGWYTAAEGGELVTKDTVFTADATVYAHWISSGGWDWAMDGTGLRIFGTGAMTDFTSDAGAPWGIDPTSVTVEAGITGVGSYAFSSCAGLTSVTLPSSVTAIGSSAFFGCTSLSDIRIPESVTKIQAGTFYQCTGLTSVTIPGSVTAIDQEAFTNCTGLTSVAVKGATSINVAAFLGCTSLRSVTIPDSGATVNSDAFQNCTGLTSIIYGGTRAMWNAFSFNDPTGGQVTIHCTDGDLAVYTVTFDGSGGTVDGASASLDTSLLGTLSALPTATRTANTDGTATYTFDGWFTAAEGGEQVTTNTVFTADTTVYAHWTSFGGWDWALEGGTLTVFGQGAMKDFAATNPPWNADMGKISTVILDNGITSVGMEAFNGCDNLTSVTLPEGLAAIGSYAFRNCTSLPAIALPETLTSLGTNFAFSNCTNLNNVVIPSKVTSIPQYTFQNCTGLTSLSIPADITTVDAAAFEGCSGLTISYGGTEARWNSILSGTLPTGVTVTFGAYTVSFNSNVSTYQPGGTDDTSATRSTGSGGVLAELPGAPGTAPTGSSGAAQYTFDGWYTAAGDGEQVTTDTVFDKDTTVYAHWTQTGGWDYRLNGTELTVFGTGDMTDYTDTSAPWGTGITSVTVGEGITSVGACAFQTCGSLNSVTLANTVETIGTAAFDSCGALTTVTLPGVKTIGEGAFNDCVTLSSVSLGSVTDIGASAFNGCKDLRGIDLSGVASIGINAFSGSGLTEVILPDSVTTVNANAFSSCAGLQSVTLGCGVSELPDSVFASCTSLTTVTFPADGALELIDQWAFQSCSSLTELDLRTGAASLTLAAYVFDPCSSLQVVRLPAQAEGSGSTFQNCSALTDIYYDGTAEQWTASFGGYSPSGVTIHYSDGTTTTG